MRTGRAHRVQSSAITSELTPRLLSSVLLGCCKIILDLLPTACQCHWAAPREPSTAAHTGVPRLWRWAMDGPGQPELGVQSVGCLPTQPLRGSINPHGTMGFNLSGCGTVGQCSWEINGLIEVDQRSFDTYSGGSCQNKMYL